MHCFTFPSKSFSSPSSLHISPEHYLWIISLNNRPHIPFLFLLIPYIFTLSYKILRLVLIVLTCNGHTLAAVSVQKKYWVRHSQAGCNTLLSRSSLKRILCSPLWTKSPVLSLYFTSCTPWLPRSSTAVASARWDGGEARQLQHSHLLTHPDNSYFQKITFCLVLFMDSFTLSTQTPICHHLKSPEVIHS